MVIVIQYEVHITSLDKPIPNKVMQAKEIKSITRNAAEIHSSASWPSKIMLYA